MKAENFLGDDNEKELGLNEIEKQLHMRIMGLIGSITAYFQEGIVSNSHHRITKE